MRACGLEIENAFLQRLEVRDPRLDTGGCLREAPFQ